MSRQTVSPPTVFVHAVICDRPPEHVVQGGHELSLARPYVPTQQFWDRGFVSEAELDPVLHTGVPQGVVQSCVLTRV